MSLFTDITPTEFKEWSFCKSNKIFYHNKCQSFVTKNGLRNNHIHCGGCGEELPDFLNYLAELGQAYANNMFICYSSNFYIF